MQLLVSVRDADEARVAVAGGADIVDAKEPSRGALGPVSHATLAGIAAALPEEIPLSVALGDALAPDDARRSAREALQLDAAFVKLGFLGVASGTLVEQRVRATIEGSGERAIVVAVAYADWANVGAASALAVVDAAARAGAHGVLLDSARKGRGGLFELLPAPEVERWLDAARAAGLLVALAGSLDEAGVARAAELGADVVGVRGAACEGGREGRLSASLVQRLARAATGLAHQTGRPGWR